MKCEFPSPLHRVLSNDGPDDLTPAVAQIAKTLESVPAYSRGHGYRKRSLVTQSARFANRQGASFGRWVGCCLGAVAGWPAG
jgi:hypothetical protein